MPKPAVRTEQSRSRKNSRVQWHLPDDEEDEMESLIEEDRQREERKNGGKGVQMQRGYQSGEGSSYEGNPSLSTIVRDASAGETCNAGWSGADDEVSVGLVCCCLIVDCCKIDEVIPGSGCCVAASSLSLLLAHPTRSSLSAC